MADGYMKRCSTTLTIPTVQLLSCVRLFSTSWTVFVWILTSFYENRCFLGSRPFRFQISLLMFSHSVVPDSLRPHRLQHARLRCPSPSPGACSNSCPLSWWCHPTIWSSVVPFSSCLQSFPASGSFLMSQFFATGGQSIEAAASASVIPTNIQGWFPLGWTGWISLQFNSMKRHQS